MIASIGTFESYEEVLAPRTREQMMILRGARLRGLRGVAGGPGRRLAGLRGPADWVVSLFGKSQAWYDNLNRVQAKLAGLAAELGAIDKGPWDALMQRYLQDAALRARSGLKYFPGYDWIQEELLKQIRDTSVMKNHVPTDQAIAAGDARGNEFRPIVNFAKVEIPAARADADQAAQETAAVMARTRLPSPAAAGVVEFQKAVEERADALAPGWGTSTMLYAAGGLAALAVLGYVARSFVPFFGRGRR